METLATPYDAVLVPVTEETRCKYRSKRCDFPRSVKRNGDLHRFCDYHRMKANLNQRRVDRRRKLRMEEQRLSGSSPPSPQDSTWYEDLDPKDLEYLDHLLSSGEADKILDGDDDVSEQHAIELFAAANKLRP